MTLPLLTHDPPEKLAVFRALQLGDMLCTVPALRALRAALPTAEITLVSLPWASEFAARFPALVDRFVAFPGHPALPEGPAKPLAFPGFLRDVQRRGFDLAIQLHGSGGITNALVALFGAQRFAGFYLPDAWLPDPDTFIPYPDHGHEAERLLALTTALGAPAQPLKLEFPLSPGDYEELAAVLPADFTDTPYVVIHPGSRAAERRWSPRSFAQVADALANQGLRVVLTGSTTEQELVTAVSAAMRAPAIDLAGSTTLGALAALMRGTRLLISNDTGASHLAAALQVPSVVLFSASDPERWAPPDRRRHIVLDAREREVPPAEAIVAARSLLPTEAIHA